MRRSNHREIGHMKKVAGAPRWLCCFISMLISLEGQALSPSQVFDRVKDSVVVVKALDSSGKTVAQGSGVLLPSGKIGTKCHVVENGSRFQVGSGKRFVPATVWGGDEDKDVCLLVATGLNAKMVQLGQASRLKVGEPVYAVGAPRGLELSLSDGIVSQLRGGPPPYIQTTAAISPGSSGGGLFDAEGRLVGFTTLYIEGGQSLNFAMPVEWVAAIKPGRSTVQGRSNSDWLKRAMALQDAQNWRSLRDWCQSWTREQPRHGFAWLCLGSSFFELTQYADAVAAFQEAVRINPDDANAWGLAGVAFTLLKRHSEALAASREAVRIDPDGGGWFTIGGSLVQLQRFDEAIDPLRQALRVDPVDVNAWTLLIVALEGSGNRNAALGAIRNLRRIDPAQADNLLNAMSSR